MSLKTLIDLDGLSRFKDIISSKIGDLSDLDTTDKSNLVAAVNEIKGYSGEYHFAGFCYGVCYTSGYTTEKIVEKSGYELVTNGYVTIKFEHWVPDNATLNINNCGARSIYYKGAPITFGVIEGGDIVTMVYSTSYHVVSIVHKYGIPKSEFESSVQVSLGKADTSLQQITEAEVNDAVEAAWSAYEISYDNTYVEYGHLRGIGVGAAPTEGVFAIKANAGDVIYILAGDDWYPEVTGSTSGSTITWTNLGNSLFSLTMPDEGIFVSLYYDD